MVELIRSALMPLGRDYSGQACSLARSLELVGERWTLLIVRDLLFGVRRFTDLQAHLDIPRAVLTDRLNTLVAACLVERRPYAKGRDEFLLTDAGSELWPVVHALMRWADRNVVDEPRRLFAHVACGTDLDPDGRCPSCGEAVHPGDVVMRAAPGVRTAREDAVSRALDAPHRLLEPLPA